MKKRFLLISIMLLSVMSFAVSGCGLSSDSQTDISADSTEAPAENFDSGTAVTPADDLASTAEQFIGQPIDALMDACGGPTSTEYEEDYETGASIGYYYYDGFSVQTKEVDGEEIVSGVY